MRLRHAWGVFFLAARSATPTNSKLVAAFRELGLEAVLLPPKLIVKSARPGDAVLGRLDVLPTLDGVETGLWELRRLERAGIAVLNGPNALLGAHDKLETAIRLGASGLPHPRTVHVDNADVRPDFGPPFVVKPRFGSWGRDVALCGNGRELASCLTRLGGRRWFARQGVLVQEFVPTPGRDLRLLVARGEVVGAVERVAAPQEWRTNVALGGVRRPTVPTAAAMALASAAAAAIDAEFVGVDLLPKPDGGYTVLELNGAVDLTEAYSLDGDVFRAVATALAVPQTTELPVAAAV